MTSPNNDTRPRPQPDEVSQFFWDGAKKGELVIQYCAQCSTYQYPPDIICIDCQSSELAAKPVSGRGSLFSYAVVDRAFHAGFVDRVPYVVGLVELEEQAGLRMLTNIVDTDPTELRVGLALEVTFEERGDAVLPQFRSARAPR